MRDYIIVGLTGPTGAGKSTVSRIFEQQDFRIIDADKVAREVMQKGSVCTKQLALNFGSDILDIDGNLNRRLLAQRAFQDDHSRQMLNDTTHPHIFLRVLRLMREYIDSGERMILFDAPVLFESNSDIMCDKIVAVTAPRDIRIERLMKRDNITKEAALLRISAQHSDEFYTTRSDYVIDGGRELTQVQEEARAIARGVGKEE